MKNSLIAAVVGLLVGVVGTETIRRSTEELLNQALRYAAGSLEEAVNQKRHIGVELAMGEPPNRPDVEKLPADVQRIIRFAEELAPKPTELLTGSVSNDDVKLLRFVQKAGDDGSHEFIELQMRRPIDLSNGQVGDAKRQPGSPNALRLPAELSLNSGDRLRIFTTENYNAFRVVELHNPKGIWKGDSGEQDRVWVSTSEGRLVLDFGYKVR
jgi:hypothetical protein